MMSVPPLTLRRLRAEWPVLALLAVGLMTVSVALSVDGINESYGTVNRIPVDGGSDQIDFLLMSWTLSEHQYLGTTSGGGPARYIVTFVDENGFGNQNPHLLQRWQTLAVQDDTPKSYAYRAPGYPIVLSSFWSLFGYRPEYVASINVGLLALAVGLLGVGLARTFSVMAGAAAGLALASSNEPIYWSGQALSETLTVALTSALIVSVAFACRRPSYSSGSIGGVVLALLALTKQMFLPIGCAYLATLLVYRAIIGRARTDLNFRIIAVAGCSFFVTISPFLIYNLNATSQLSMATGTAGWHDMPSTYSENYLRGENRFTEREAIFSEFEHQNGVRLTSDIDRARAGREIWFKEFRDGHYWPRILRLMMLKIQRSLDTDFLGWTLRLLTAAGLFLRRSGKDNYVWGFDLLLGGFFLTAVAFISLTVEDGARLLVFSWGVIAALFGIGISHLYRPFGGIPRIGSQDRSLEQ